MALPPNIPTSFVPKQPISSQYQRPKQGMSAVSSLAYFFLLLSLVGAGAVFAFHFYLSQMMIEKKAEIEAVRQDLALNTVETFTRERDRFAQSKQLMENHTSISQFLSLLESITLSNVQFETLVYIRNEEDQGAEVELTGVASSFNALAAQSSLFSEQTEIRNAIFSDIVNEEEGVSFSLVADVEPSLVVLQLPENPVNEEVGEPLSEVLPSGIPTSPSSP